MGSLLHFWTGLIKRKKYILKGQFDYCYTFVMRWIIDWMSMLIAPWISDFATEYSRAVAILKLVIISPHPDGRMRHMSVLLGLNLPPFPVHSFHPDFSISSLGPRLPPTPDTSGSQAVVWSDSQGSLLKGNTPTLLVLTWQTWDSVLLISISEAGLGVSFWKELAEVEMPYEVPGSRLWEQPFPPSGFQPSASLLVDLSPAQLV